jgi:hypothetical protein
MDCAVTHGQALRAIRVVGTGVWKQAADPAVARMSFTTGAWSSRMRHWCPQYGTPADVAVASKSPLAGVSAG